MFLDHRPPSKFPFASLLVAGLCLGCSSSDSQVGQGTAPTTAPSGKSAAPAFAPQAARPPARGAASPTPRVAGTPSGTATTAADAPPITDFGEQAPDALTLHSAKLTFSPPRPGEQEHAIGVTSDGDVALEGPLFAGAAQSFLQTLPAFPIDAIIEWTDYRDGSVNRRRAKIESVDRVFIVPGEAPPRAAPQPTAAAGSPPVGAAAPVAQSLPIIGPPAAARMAQAVFNRGRKLEHQIEPPAPAGATLTLLSGPPGMTVSPAGAVEWVPAPAAADRYAAIIGIDFAGEPRNYRVVQLAAENAAAPAATRAVRIAPAGENTAAPDVFASQKRQNADPIVAYQMTAVSGGGQAATGGPIRPIPPNRQMYAPPGATGFVALEPGTIGRWIYVMTDGRRFAAMEIRKPLRIFKTNPAGGAPTVTQVGGDNTTETLLPLPAPVTDVVLAGDGRYLLLAFASLRHVGVFDLRTAEIVHFVDTGSEDFLVAGGKTRFVVYDRASRKLRRANLATGEIDKEAVLAQRFGKLDALGLGFESEGPVYFLGELTDVERGCNLKKLDLETLTPVELTTSDKYWGGPNFNDLSVSADGRRVGWGQPHDRFQIFEIEGNEAKLLRFYTSMPGSVVINRAGDGFFSGPEKRLIPDVMLVTGKGRGLVSGEALEGSYWYTASFRPAGAGPTGLPIQFFAGGETTPVAQVSIPGFGPSDVAWNNGRSTPAIRRPLHYSLPEKTLAVVAQSPPRVVVKRFDVRAAAKDSKFDVLTVASTPPPAFSEEPNLTYQIETISRRGGLTYRLESGPADMTVSPAGLVAWKGPTLEESFRRPVLISVSDASGRTTRHAFHVPSSSFEAAPLPAAVASAIPAPVATAVATSGGTTGGTAGGTAEPPPTPADHMFNLPDAPAAVEGAGDGRYLLLAFPQLRKVGLFDLRAAAAPRLIDVGSSRFLIAGGLTRFVVVDQEKKRLLRYHLETGELENEAPFIAGSAGVTAATMGVASEGPVILWFGGDPAGSEMLLRVADLETLAVRSVDVADRKSIGLFEKSDLVKEVHRISASADGSRIVVAHHGGYSNSGNRWTMLAERDGRAVLLDGASGDKHTRAAYDGGSVFDHAGRDPVCQTNAHFTGDFFPVRSCFSVENWLSYARSRSRALYVRFHKGLDTKVLGTVTIDVDFDDNEGARVAETSYYSAGEKALAIVLTKPDRIALVRIDADAVVAAAKTPYFAFNSSPPLRYPPGGKVTYQLRAVSDSPEIRFHLQSGPEGMTVSPTGLLEWKAPAPATAKKGFTKESVVVAATSAGGEVLQKFTIRSDVAAFILYGTEAKAKSTAPAGAAVSPGKTDPVPGKSSGAGPATPGGAGPATPGGAGPATPELRKWTSTDGQFAITATLVEVKGDTAVLKGADGKTIEVPLEKLSPEDRAFARAAAKKP